MTHFIYVKALRFHPCLYFLIESIVGVVEVFSSHLYKEAKTINKIKPRFRCLYVLVQLMKLGAFRNSDYNMHPTATIPASALSFFPQDLFSVRAEKKS